MIALLPMYDWPEIRAETDRLWQSLRRGFLAAGIDAPEFLDRATQPATGWRASDLLLGQTCGLPYVRTLRDHVTLIGAPDYAVPGCAPGWYRSAILIRADDPRDTLAAFRGARLALNGYDSQSGYAAMAAAAAPLARNHEFFGPALVTGAHAHAAAAVAQGRADIAAVDFISWRLFARYRPAAADLRILMLTDPTPGLPLIAASGTDAARHAAIITKAIATLDQPARSILGLRGFAELGAAEYRIIEDRARAAEALLSL